MRIDFDPEKSRINAVQRGLPFELAAYFEFDTALINEDTRRNYGEIRYSAIGNIHERLHVLAFKETPWGIRVISLRKANFREVCRYESATNTPQPRAH